MSKRATAWPNFRTPDRQSKAVKALETEKPLRYTAVRFFGDKSASDIVEASGLAYLMPESAFAIPDRSVRWKPLHTTFC